jgi:AcrR family transcriptional regulator
MTVRAPEATRRRILEAAFHEVHGQGFRAASLDSVIRAAGTTKGALYHHFRNKDELGHAVLEELIGLRIREFHHLMKESPRPLAALRAWCLTPPPLPVEYGCPLNNLAQELASIDEAFRQRIDSLFQLWREAIATGLRRARDAGTLRAGVDPDALAGFVLATLEGSISLAKSARDRQVFHTNAALLVTWLDGLQVAEEV